MKFSSIQWARGYLDGIEAALENVTKTLKKMDDQLKLLDRLKSSPLSWRYELDYPEQPAPGMKIPEGAIVTYKLPSSGRVDLYFRKGIIEIQHYPLVDHMGDRLGVIPLDKRILFVEVVKA